MDGWMYPKSSILRKVFDDQILKLYEEGIVDKLLRSFEFPEEPSEFVPVNLEFVLILFITILIGIFLSFVIFVLEKFQINLFGYFNQWP